MFNLLVTSPKPSQKPAESQQGTLYDGGPYYVETGPLIYWCLCDREGLHEIVKVERSLSCL